MVDTDDDNNTVDSEECAEETFQMDFSFDVEIIQDGGTSRDYHSPTSSDDSSTSSDCDSSGCYVTMETSPPSSYRSASLPLYYEVLKQSPDGADSDKCDSREKISEYTGLQKPGEQESEIAQFIREILCKCREDAMRQDEHENPNMLLESEEKVVTKNRGRCARQKKKIRRRAKQSQSSKTEASTRSNEKKGIQKVFI